MHPIQLGYCCPICQQRHEINTAKPLWGAPKNIKLECLNCKTDWTIKLIRVQGEVAKGEDIEVHQTLVKLGQKVTPSMAQKAISRAKPKKGIIETIKEKVGL